MRILLTGASGQLGGYLLRTLREQDADVVAWSHAKDAELFGFNAEPVDLTDESATSTAFQKASPDIVIHAAGLTKVQECLEDPNAAHKINVEGTRNLAKLAAARGARLIFTSTDMVFNGDKGNYSESESTAPLSAYGRSKADAEAKVLAYERGLVCRMSLMFGLTLVNRPVFFDHLVQNLRSGKPVTLYEDEWRTPLDLGTAARCLILLAASDRSGIIHVGGAERMTRYQIGLLLAKHLGCAASLIEPVKVASEHHAEPRPRDCSLNTTLLRKTLPDLEFPSWQESFKTMCNG